MKLGLIGIMLFSFSAFAAADDPTAWVTADMKTSLMAAPSVQARIAKIPNLDQVNCQPANEDNLAIYADDETAQSQEPKLAKFQLQILCKLKKGPPPNAVIEVNGVLILKRTRVSITNLDAKLTVIPCSKLGPRYHSHVNGCK